MTIHDSIVLAARRANLDPGPMRYFTEIGTLLLAHRLPPLLGVCDLLWRYVRNENHDFSLAVDRALAAGPFDLSVVSALRRTHCGDMAASKVSAFPKAAHGQAEALTQRIEAGRTDLADYGHTTADVGARLKNPINAAGRGSNGRRPAGDARYRPFQTRQRSLRPRYGRRGPALCRASLGRPAGAAGRQVGRFGGEEFIALLPGHDVMRAAAVIDAARAKLASQTIRNAVDGLSMDRVSFPAGVSGDRADDSCNSLIARAYGALYNAKRTGRDRLVPGR